MKAPPPSVRNVRRSVPPAPPSGDAPPSSPGDASQAAAPSERPLSVPPVAGDVAPKPRKAPAPAGESRALRVVRGIVGLALIAGIGSGVAWGARRYVRTSPRFAVSEIVTSGGKRRGPDDIANIANVAKGQNIFSIELDRARARLTADPWIETAEVGRQLPGTITIRVGEREAGGIVAMSEGTYLVTRDGVLIKRVESGDPLDFHVVTGVPVKALLEDREGATRTIRQALDLATEYEHSPLAQRSPLEEVHVEPNGDMTIVAGKSGVVLKMGAAPYRRKLDQAVRIVSELDRRGAKPDVILLDDEARPDRVVVRMK